MAIRKGGAHSAPKKNNGGLPSLFGSRGASPRHSHREQYDEDSGSELFDEKLSPVPTARQADYCSGEYDDFADGTPAGEYDAFDETAEYFGGYDEDAGYDDAEAADSEDDFGESEPDFPPLFGVEPPAARRERMQEPGFVRQCVFGLILVLIICAVPMYSLYLQNVGYLTLGGVSGTMLISMLVGALVYAALVLIIARPAASALFTSVLMYLVLNFSSLRNFTGKIAGSGASGIFSLILLLIIAAAVWFLLRKARRATAVLNVFTMILSLVMVAMMGISTVRALPEIRAARERARTDEAFALAQEEANTSTVAIAAPKESEEDFTDLSAVQEEIAGKKDELMALDLSYGQPNLYFFIFDEMGCFAEVEKYYDYDTSEFQEFLTENHINYSLTSHSTSRHTKESISAMLNAVKPEGQRYDYYDFGKNNLVRQALEKHGYQLFRLNEINKVFCNVDNLFTSLSHGGVTARTEDGLTSEDIAYENSILSLLLERSKESDYTVSDQLLTTEEILATKGYEVLQPYSYKYLVQSILSYFDYFETPENLIPNAGLGFLTYATTTHVPLLFQADGNIPEERERQRNWRDPEVYLGAYEFTLSHIKRIFSNILENDPDSIIIVMSDHGVRYHTEGTLKMEFEISEEDATNISNMIYYRGIDLNIEGISSLDTIRLLLNLLGEDVEMDGISMADIIPENVVLSYGENMPQWAIDLYTERGVDLEELGLSAEDTDTAEPAEKEAAVSESEAAPAA